MVHAILIWIKTDRDYRQSVSYGFRSCTDTEKRFHSFLENMQLISGVLVKIDITYGGNTSIGCATVNKCSKLWNILGVSRWYKYGIKNNLDIISL